MLACILGRPGEVFFPKLGEDQMLTFSNICDDFVKANGFEKDPCATDAEAKKKAAALHLPSDIFNHFEISSGSDYLRLRFGLLLASIYDDGLPNRKGRPSKMLNLTHHFIIIFLTVPSLRITMLSPFCSLLSFLPLGE